LTNHTRHPRTPRRTWTQTLVKAFPGLADHGLPEGTKGLAGLVVDSVSRCDADVRKDLYQHVVLAGEGLEELGRSGLLVPAIQPKWCGAADCGARRAH
jgi:hypothetical protein